ncbi:hypothetical protein PINS_up000312 [Pythium insidiosum]|nr:hypothetical protein PINS_up000312 [Pythium insidiosum]
MAWKDVEFMGSDSAERLARLQRFCGDPSTGDIDGLLIIGGVDSFHSSISQAVLKYLLLGSSGQELLGEQVIPQDHDRLDDVVLVIRRQCVSVFYSSESDAAVTMLPKLSQWRNVTEFVVDDNMEPDEQEARKIAAFKEMVRGLKRVGIPFGLNANGDDLRDTMVPEKWPLVQSYGLENGNQASARGAKGFFTMNHEVVNVSRMLCDAMAQLDTFSAKRIVYEAEPLLRHHFDEFLLRLDHAESPQQRDSKSEADMGDDLISLFEFGTTQFDTRGLRVEAHRGARVLFGKRTASITTKPSSRATLRDSGGVPGQPATHMLVQAEDPFSGVRLTRTYFLATGKLAMRVVDEDALVQSDADHVVVQTNSAQRDTMLLIHLYAALVRGFRAGVSDVIHTMRSMGPSGLTQALVGTKARVIQAIRAALHLNDDVTLPERFLDEHVVVDVELLNACGQRITPQTTTEWHLFYVTAEIQNVRSVLSPQESLGSLIVGDTFLLNRSRQDAAVVNVTDAFAYLRTWLQSGREAESAAALRKALQSEFMLRSPALELGQPLMPLDVALDDGNSATASASANSIASTGAPPSIASMGISKATLLLECEELPLLQGGMQLYSGGFCFYSPQVLPVVVSFAKHVNSFCLLSTPYEELVLLRFELKKEPTESRHTALGDCLPVPLASPSIALPLLAGTRFQEEILRALDTWKTTASALEIPLYRPHDLVMYEGETPRDGSAMAASELAPVMAKTCDTLVPVERGTHTRNKLRAIELLFPRAFIPRDSNPVTALPKPRADRSKLLVPITVTLGLPGSAVESIAAQICELSATDYDWLHVVVDARGTSSVLSEAQVFDEIQRRITSTLQRIAASSPSELPPRVMLTVNRPHRSDLCRCCSQDAQHFGTDDDQVELSHRSGHGDQRRPRGRTACATQALRSAHCGIRDARRCHAQQRRADVTARTASLPH